MQITILERPDVPHYQDAKPHIYLIWDNWNDYSYRTVFGVRYIKEGGEEIDLDGIRIAHFGQGKGKPKLQPGDTFKKKITHEYFSLGYGEYYDRLSELGDKIREEILFSLNDIARYPDIYEKAIHEEVTKVSLLRNYTETEVTGQLRRMANGGVRLTPYKFSYEFSESTNKPLIRMEFDVEPESNPPTNIHVIIGRNGVGKTYLLRDMIKSLLHKDIKTYGVFKADETLINNEILPNLIFISFSAFDDIGPEFIHPDIYSGIGYTYIGLKKINYGNNNTIELKTTEEIKQEFILSLLSCKKKAKDRIWRNAVTFLISDSYFKEVEITSLINGDNRKILQDAEQIFNKLSSGHKIVLLTITRLVETIEEKTLVMIDEPETHLHPPLLSAFARAISVLLIDRNGVAIIATHSPVILQEVPRNCVWKLRRSENMPIPERLDIESFGENVGILTQDVFGLEVTESGFHQILRKVAGETNSYEEATRLFANQLGQEARAILRNLFFQKSKRDEINN